LPMEEKQRLNGMWVARIGRIFTDQIRAHPSNSCVPGGPARSARGQSADKAAHSKGFAKRQRR
jgi:hypothetical protein